jgi:hypothetical protein
MLSKNSRVKDCADYFPQDSTSASNCLYYNQKSAEFMIETNGDKQSLSSYIYNNQETAATNYKIEYKNTGDISISIVNIADRILVAILVLLSVGAILISCDIFILYRKKNKSRKRINKMRKAV